MRFDQNNSIGIHFTIEKQIGVAKNINRGLLEKVWYLLSNASLDKTFWAEALVYASHLMNRLSSTGIGGILYWIFGQVDLLKTIVCCRYLNVDLLWSQR